VLQALASQHALPGIILQHRKLHKLKTGFMNSLGTKLAELQQQQRASASGSDGYTAAQGSAAAAAVAPAGPCALLDGDCRAMARDSSATDHTRSSNGIVRIRGSFLQTNTATGRLSMDDPALQTMPRPVDFQLELPAAARQPHSGSELSPVAGGGGGAVRLQQVQVNVRASFVAPPGWVLLSADYSQIELRLVRRPGLGRGVPACTQASCSCALNTCTGISNTAAAQVTYTRTYAKQQKCTAHITCAAQSSHVFLALSLLPAVALPYPRGRWRTCRRTRSCWQH
jgi:hypothetical protein